MVSQGPADKRAVVASLITCQVLNRDASPTLLPPGLLASDGWRETTETALGRFIHTSTCIISKNPGCCLCVISFWLRRGWMPSTAPCTDVALLEIINSSFSPMSRKHQDLTETQVSSRNVFDGEDR